MALIHEVDREIFQRGHEYRIRREVRHAHGWQVTDALLADDDIRRERLGVFLLLVHQREIFVGQQLTANDGNEFRVILINLVNQGVGTVHHQRVEVLIVAVFANANHVRNNGTVLSGDFAHHARRSFVAVLLQPADGHILQHRVFAAV